jgi:cytochrome c peroxidase
VKSTSLRRGIAMPLFFSVFVAILFVFISCQKKKEIHQDQIKTASDGPALPSVPYQYPVGGNNYLATLGRVLFYDKNLSADGSVSCGSCHQQVYGFADNKKFSTGANGLLTPRNTHAITKVNNSRFWDGKNQMIFNDSINLCTGFGGYTTPDTIICMNVISSSTSVFKDPITIPFITNSEMSLSMTEVCNKLSKLKYYTKLFNDAFPGDSVKISEKNIHKALGTFLDNIVPSNSNFDQIIALGGTKFSPEEMDGWNIFNGKGKCNLCHKANNAFGGSPGQFEDIGLDLVYNDPGRKDISFSSKDEGRFHIPSLKNISLTAPYMHDGRFRSLSQVIDFFSEGIQNSPNISSAFSSHPITDSNGNFVSGGTVQQLNLTPAEKEHLLAFLNTLTDYTLVSDQKFADPFKH